MLLARRRTRARQARVSRWRPKVLPLHPGGRRSRRACVCYPEHDGLLAGVGPAPWPRPSLAPLAHWVAAQGDQGGLLCFGRSGVPSATRRPGPAGGGRVFTWPPARRGRGAVLGRPRPFSKLSGTEYRLLEDRNAATSRGGAGGYGTGRVCAPGWEPGELINHSQGSGRSAPGPRVVAREGPRFPGALTVVLIPPLK